MRAFHLSPCQVGCQAWRLVASHGANGAPCDQGHPDFLRKEGTLRAGGARSDLSLALRRLGHQLQWALLLRIGSQQPSGAATAPPITATVCRVRVHYMLSGRNPWHCHCTPEHRSPQLLTRRLVMDRRRLQRTHNLSQSLFAACCSKCQHCSETQQSAV